MSFKLYLENFEEIYNDTYDRTLRYIICNCSNIQDVNDLVQETYLELYKLLQRKKEIELENFYNYIIGIAKIRIQKHYGNVQKNISLENEDYYEQVPADIDIELDTINKLNAEKVWKFIKQKDILVVKVFYLYYYLELKISQIATELSLTESNVKNILYRTIKDIKENVKIEGDEDV